MQQMTKENKEDSILHQIIFWLKTVYISSHIQCKKINIQLQISCVSDFDLNEVTGDLSKMLEETYLEFDIEAAKIIL